MSGEWQPIETAPRDGTWVIVYRPNANEYIRHIGQDHWRLDLEGGCWGGSPALCQPTHWMPFPEPPAESPRVHRARSKEPSVPETATNAGPKKAKDAKSP